MDINALIKLTLERIEAKRKEDAAATDRKRLDAEIAAILEEDLKTAGKATGTVGRRLEEQGIRVVASFSQSASVDQEALARDLDKLPGVIRDAFRVKYEPVSDKVKALPPADLLTLAKYVTTKPASPSIKVEVL